MPKPKRAADARRAPAARPVAAPPRPFLGSWYWAAIAFFAFIALYVVYDPALNGPFVFDDVYLRFADGDAARSPLSQWLIGVRPLLNFTFWVNYRLSEMAPYSYHFGNVLLHFGAGVFLFLIVRKLLRRAGADAFRREAISLFCGSLFLLHPLQTESVAYVASRSEALSVMFFYAAFAVFLYRRSEAISWPASFAVLALFAAAAATKEHTAVLPFLLLLTDYWWNPGFSLQGIRRNWRLYAVTAAGSVGAFLWVAKVLREANTAGFSVKEFTWFEYFLSQCRAIWFYLRLLVLPYNQNLDHEFAVSRSLLDYGTILALLALAGITGAAIWYRRRYPLASYGWLVFLLLIAPTSSFIPIADLVAEHRIYLPFIGLLLVAAEFLVRWKTSRAALVTACAGAVIVMAWIAHDRNLVWRSSVALWEDSVSKSPAKYRPHFQLGYAYYSQQRCAAAVSEYQKAVAYAATPDHRLLVDWALAYSCAGNHDAAVQKLTEAAQINRTARVYSLLGLEYMNSGRQPLALQALNTAVKLDPNYDMTYVYRAVLFANNNDYETAAAEYSTALRLNPRNSAAQRGLGMIEQRTRGRR